LRHGIVDSEGRVPGLRLWGRRSAFNVQKAMWAIAELGLECERIEIGGASGGLDTPEFLLMNPNGRIPVLEDDGLVVWESHTIVRYLAATYGLGSLWPSDSRTRSLADRWMDWMLATLQPAFMNLFWGFYRTPEEHRDGKAIKAAMRQCENYFAVLDAHLQDRGFVAGESFSMGDIPAATSLYRYFEMGISVPKIPNVRAWYERLGARAAYRLAVMTPFEELRGSHGHRRPEIPTT
jgi:glutathione S-transferase